MNFSDSFLQALAAILAIVMGLVALANWLNRKHGGFAKGWAGAIFISICWASVFVLIFLKLDLGNS